MSITRPRSQTISEGDWVTLNETIRDLSFAVNQLADAASAEAAYHATVQLRSEQSTVGVALDGDGLYEWSLVGVGPGATAFIGSDGGGTITWSFWAVSSSTLRVTGSGSAGALSLWASASRTAICGVVSSARTGWAYSGSGKVGGTSFALFGGQSDAPLGRLLQFTGGFKAGTVLSVRRVG